MTIPLPKTGTDEAFRKLPPFIANEQNEGRWRLRFDTPERFQESMKNYYRLVSEVDSTCGRVLDELKKQGVLNNTLVIFTGDNGYFLGEHGLADKWYPFEESIRVPLIVRDPRLAPAKHGETNDDFTLNVDLAPTILATAGISPLPKMQGHDIAPLYLADKKPIGAASFSTNTRPSETRISFQPRRLWSPGSGNTFTGPNSSASKFFRLAKTRSKNTIWRAVRLKPRNSH